ncbi:MAG TPA: UDP-N-acetylglucosamine 2-epimerase [Acidimicrobiales bacterium]|nr:UDP-N-acetylglucosamine 2-epimerase [Acidimicrobiales bacterium]
MDRLHIFLGTKAQYIKTAPVLRLLDDRGVDYRLIDSGQHARISVGMRGDLGLRSPDHFLGGEDDIDSIPQFLRWSGTLAARLPSARRLRRDVFGGDGGICVVHGDTPSTLLSAAMARRAGLRVAHLEAGLRSHNVFHPFPEEAIRIVVMRLAHLLFAPDATAVHNLESMGVKGRVVPVSGNTSVDALRSTFDHVFPSGMPPGMGEAGDGPVVVTMHRVENLHSKRSVGSFVELVSNLATRHDVRFVVHGPTREVIERTRAVERLTALGVDLRPLSSHADFIAAVARAPFVITDGGSIQEECALLGVPTLLWRYRTERPDGLGANVVLSRYDDDVVRDFLADPERLRRKPVPLDASPAAEIVEVLLEELANPPS